MDKSLKLSEFKKDSSQKVLVATLNHLSKFAKDFEKEEGPYVIPDEMDSFNQKAEMEGPYQYTLGETYLGQYLEGKRHGKGKQIWPDGSVYDG